MPFLGRTRAAAGGASLPGCVCMRRGRVASPCRREPAPQPAKMEAADEDRPVPTMSDASTAAPEGAESVASLGTATRAAAPPEPFSDGSLPDEAPLEESQDDPKTAETIRQLMALREPGQPLHLLSDSAKACGDEALCRRLLEKHRGDPRKCAERYKQALHWAVEHEEMIRTRDYPLATDMRVVGRNAARQPIVYMCARNQMLPSARSLDQGTVEYLNAIDLLPPGEQKTVHLWDLHKIDMNLNWSPAPLLQFVRGSQHYFAERLQELIIVDMPMIARLVKDAVWPLMPESSKQKVKFLTYRQAQEHLWSVCEPDEAERLIGIMQQNRDPRSTLQERRRSWTQLDKTGRLVPFWPEADAAPVDES